MNSTFKKLIAVILSVAIIIGSATAAFAVSVKELPKDEVYPTIVIHGIGQANTFMVDENGNDVYDNQGKPITGWPLYFNVPRLVIKLIIPLVLTLFTQRDIGLCESIYKAAYDELSITGYNEDATPKNNFRVKNYGNRPVSQCTEEEKEEIFDHVPLDDFASRIGEENLYYFAYNSFGSVKDIVDQLEVLIEKAKKDTGKNKVNLVPISLGGAICVAYTNRHPQGEDINKIVLIVPAADGSEIVGKIMLGQLDYSDEGIYRNMFTKLVGEDNYTGWLINILLRILPKSEVKGVLSSLAAGISDALLSKVTTMWGLVPSSMYEELAEKYLVEGTEFAKEVEQFHTAQTNFISNLQNYKRNGVKIYNICGYGVELYSLIDSDSNSDKIIHSASTSLGAHFSKVNTTLPEDYVQQKFTETDFISPDRQVDASTCAFPYTTWFFCNQDHEDLGDNDVVIRLATELLIVKDMDVFTTPEYPQFNMGRETGDLKSLLLDAKNIDTSTLDNETKMKLSDAISFGEKVLSETIVIEGRCESAENSLKEAMHAAGAYTYEDTKKDDALLFIFKGLSEILFEYFGARGFSER